MKIKCFSNYSPESLERDVNDFLSSIKPLIFNTEFNVAAHKSGVLYYSYVISYFEEHEKD